MFSPASTSIFTAALDDEEEEDEELDEEELEDEDEDNPCISYSPPPPPHAFIATLYVAEADCAFVYVSTSRHLGLAMR